MTDLRPEGYSWKLCLIGGCAFTGGACFNCGAAQEGESNE